MWERPNDYEIIMRCTNRKHGKLLLEKGSVKFNTPQSWVEEELKNGKGRGDILEGTFAACYYLNVKEIIKYSKMFDDVYGETRNELTYFRRKRTMQLMCYCFYILRREMFKCPKKEGIQDISTVIPGSYFRDFAGNKFDDEINRMDDKEKPSVVVMNDGGEFIKRIYNKLLKMGLQENEILLELVEYQDKNIDHYCTAQSPRELKIKPLDFKHQAEGRIIINTDKKDILEYLRINAIEIGSIEDIAQKSDEYLSDGIEVKMTVNIYKVNEDD